MKREQMEMIALNVLTCSTFIEAANKSGISESTLYKLRQRKVFQEILTSMKNRIFGDTMLKAQAYSMEALDVLRAVMHNKKSNDTAKMSAARSILDMSLNAHGTEEIINRLTVLESVNNGN